MERPHDLSRQAAENASGTGHHIISNYAYVLTPAGLVYEPRTYEDLFKRTLKAAGISNINFHALRHTFATRALEAGMDIKVLSSILGHAQASTTLNLYAHALPDHKKLSMEKMGSFYGTVPNPTVCSEVLI